METWKEIEGTHGSYQVSDLGRVKRMPFQRTLNRSVLTYPEKIISPTDNGHGYCVISISINSKVTKHKVHRLVAQAFHPNPNSYPAVNHINGTKTDNRAINLEWCDKSMNEKHAYKVLGKKSPMIGVSGSDHHNAVPVVQLTKEGVFVKEYRCLKDAEKLGFDFKCVSGVCRGICKTHKGFFWMYKSVYMSALKEEQRVSNYSNTRN